jgi:ribosomal protein L36
MCVCILALLNRHAKRLHRITLPFVVCLALPYSSHYTHTIHGTIHGRELLNKFMLPFYLQILCEKFLIIRRNGRDFIINVHKPSCKYSLFFGNFNETRSFSMDFRKIKQIQNFINIIPSSGSRVVPCGQTDGRT